MNMQLCYLPLISFPLILAASFIGNIYVRLSFVFLFSLTGIAIQLAIFGRHKCLKPCYDKKLRVFTEKEEELRLTFEKTFKEYTQRRNNELAVCRT